MFLLAFSLANRWISSFLSTTFASLFSMESIAKPESLSWDILDLRYVFISFSLENEHSAVATVTGIVANRMRSLYTCEKEELTRLSSIKRITPVTDSRSAISFLNSLTKDRNSDKNQLDILLPLLLQQFQAEVTSTETCFVVKATE